MSLADALISFAIDPSSSTSASDGSATVALYAMIGVLGSALILGVVQVITSRGGHNPHKAASKNTAQARRERHYAALILFLANNGELLHVDARKIKTGYESMEEVRRD